MMSDNNNNKSDNLPEWMDDFSSEKENSSSENENISPSDPPLDENSDISFLNESQSSDENSEEDVPDWIQEIRDGKLPEKNTASLEDSLQKKTLVTEDETDNFLYEIENMIDDKSYLNLSERSEHEVDGNEWQGWHNEDKDDTDDWLTNFSKETNITPPEIIAPQKAFKENAMMDENSDDEPSEEVASLSESETSTDDLPSWINKGVQKKDDKVEPVSNEPQEAIQSEETTNAFDSSSPSLLGFDEEESKSEDLPDWLKNATDETEEDFSTQSKSQEISSEQNNSSNEIPAWLMEESELDNTLDDEQEAPLDSSDSISQPDFQSPTISDIPIEKDEQTFLDAFPKMDAEEMDDIDEYLDDSQIVKEAFPKENLPKIKQAQMPAWMKSIRPVDAVELPDVSESETTREVTIGPLTGFRGIIPVEPEIIRFSPPSAIKNRLDISEKQSMHATILGQLFEPEKTKPQTDEKNKGLSIGGRFLIPILLVLALMGANFIDLPFVDSPMSVAGLSFEQSMSALPEQANALLIMDYQLGVQRELSVGLDSLVFQLNEKDAKVFTVTTHPMGNGLANILMQDHPEIEIQHLGYLTGNASAISQFATNSTFTPSVESLPIGIATIDDFDVVILVTDRVQSIQNWAEQASPIMVDTPFLVLASAKIQPIVEIYFNTSPQRINGYLCGYYESVVYQKNIGSPNLAATETWDAVYIVTLVVIMTLMLGSMVSVMKYVLKNVKKDKEVEK